MRIDSSISYGPKFDADFNDEDIKNEPMFFNSSYDFASNNGGPITRGFLKAFASCREAPLDSLVFDSRVHMLMPGMYPCIPGYHRDDVPRPKGQPDYYTPAYRSRHALGLVNAHVAPTEFAIGAAEFSEPTGVVYQTWHPEVVRKIAKGELRTVPAESGRIIFFDDRTWHQGTLATRFGWRWFGRLSWDTNRRFNITNEIRKQVQVYMPAINSGW